MSTKIILKKSSVADKEPLVGDVTYGELALNYADGLLFYKNNSNVIKSIGVEWNNISNNPSTTVGDNLLTLSNPGAITFLQVNANNTVTALSDSAFRTAIGAINYSHPTHPGDDISVDTGPLTGAAIVSDIDINVTTDGEGHVTDANGVVATRTLTLANLGYTGSTTANDYTHPTYTARTENGDTGALTGATVISDLDFNISVDTSGHVTSADITTLATRELGFADLSGNISCDNISCDNITTGGYLRGPATFTIDPLAYGDDTGKVVIAGDLQVDGTTTTINSETVNVTDKNVQLATGSTNAAAATGAGITVDLGSDGTATLSYDGAADDFTFNKALYISTNRVLTTADEGSGNGIDADTVDTLHASQFLRSDTNDTATGKITIVKNVGSSSTYNSGQLELQCSDDGDASIGFHRTGSTACQLRHESNGLILSGTTQTADADLTVTRDIYCTVLHGTATTANYADLAEKYTVATDVNPGDVIVISQGVEFDCELAGSVASQAVLGVVSENPAFAMNEKLEGGTYIALKGRVQCKVIGFVAKGDPLVTAANGMAMSINNPAISTEEKMMPGIIFGKALASSDGGENIIEVIVL